MNDKCKHEPMKTLDGTQPFSLPIYEARIPREETTRIVIRFCELCRLVYWQEKEKELDKTVGIPELPPSDSGELLEMEE